MRWGLALTMAGLLAAGTILTAGSAPADGAPALERQAVVLVHHPLDHVDPFGVPYGTAGNDTFSARYSFLLPAGAPFPFPTFVADGGSPILSLPDPARPLQATVANYSVAVDDRLRADAPASISLAPRLAGGRVLADVEVRPVAPLSEGIHLVLALTEDAIPYQPPAPVSNGVTVHRFTVRALLDAGAVDLRQQAAQSFNVSFRRDPAWDAANLGVAAWLQVVGGGGRFADGEVLQAASARVGESAVQASKAVLVEVYSATWCTPCLYSDLAVEELAVTYAGATPISPAATTYFVAPGSWWLAVAAAVAGATLFAAMPGRRP